MTTSAGIQFDDAWAQRIEAVYTTSDVVKQRQVVLDHLSLVPGERVLDIGCGPGLLAYSMAEVVGPDGAVHGIDPSTAMVAMAQQRCAAMPWTEFRQGDATTLPYADGTYDVAVATQVLEYVADVDMALTELGRVLRVGGRALVLDTDWDTIVWHTEDPQRMQRVLAAFEAHCAHPRLPRTLAARLRRAGLELERTSTHVTLNTSWRPDGYSYGITNFIASYVREHALLPAEEVEAWAAELRQLGEADTYFFSLNRYLFYAVKA